MLFMLEGASGGKLAMWEELILIQALSIIIISSLTTRYTGINTRKFQYSIPEDLSNLHL